MGMGVKVAEGVGEGISPPSFPPIGGDERGERVAVGVAVQTLGVSKTLGV